MTAHAHFGRKRTSSAVEIRTRQKKMKAARSTAPTMIAIATTAAANPSMSVMYSGPVAQNAAMVAGARSVRRSFPPASERGMM
jgi:hypothetical protein